MMSLPMIAASRLLDICGFPDLVNERTDWDPAQCKVEPGDGAKAMVISMFLDRNRPVLSGVADAFIDAPLNVLFDSVSEREDLNRYALASILDRIYEAGPSELFRSFADGVRTAFGGPLRALHGDTTTVSVEGEYFIGEGDDPSVKIVRGYSKDLRPDLKQYVLGYAVGDDGLLMEARMLDGNHPDTEWNRMCVDSLAETMRSLGLVFVADCKLADAPILRRMAADGLMFLTRCPANFGKCLEASVLKAVPLDRMADAGAASSAKNAARRTIWETSAEAEGLKLRAVAVKSSSMYGKGEKAVDKDRERAEGLLKAFDTEYACEADARKAFARLGKKTSKTVFDAAAEFVPRIAEERPRGRPRKDGRDVMRKTVWNVNAALAVNEERAEALRRSSEMYVLISNVPSKEDDPEKGMDAEELVRLYAGQWRVEGMFKTVKTPALADGLFIKTEERAEALLCLINTAVLLRGLMQLMLRRGIAGIPEEDLPMYGRDNGRIQSNVTADYFIRKNQHCAIMFNTSAGKYWFLDEGSEEAEKAVFFMGLMGIPFGEFFG